MSARMSGSQPLPQPLDPLALPLSGRSLIEASAGTGKTFTIAMLYVRLVLGHDPSRDATQGAARPLQPPEILVVTFTDAATKELRDRIRARLTEAAAVFQQTPDEAADDYDPDNLLHALRDTIDESLWETCALRLRLAAEWMDEAAVSTIHGWCNRMLREHAFDSDSLFSQTLETDQSELLAEVVRDYWRIFMAPLDADDARTVAQWLSGPEELQPMLRKLLDVVAQLPVTAAPQETLRLAEAERQRILAALKAPWAAWPAEMKALLDAAREAGQYSGTQLRKADCERWFAELAQWAVDHEALKPNLTDTAYARLDPAALLENCAHGEPPLHPGFAALAAMRATLDKLPHARDALLAHAARWVAQRFAQEQDRRAQMGFDDLLTRLDAALHGPNGARLAEVIRTQFPVALIDEFQDTDPVQYRIFDAVYGEDAGDEAQPTHGLILIGDPKQAIYAFRGADIFTYLAARRSCGPHLYTLSKNFRSTGEMVAAVNACFDAAEQRAEGEGAFLFRGSSDTADDHADEASRSALNNPVPFMPVSAKGNDRAFIVEGVTPRALTAWCVPGPDDGKPLGKGAFTSQMAQGCATGIARLLSLGQRGEAGFARLDNAGDLKPLRPADIAVLVNGRVEADEIRAALEMRGVRTVYLSDSDSVFQSEQAAEMQHWLAACAEPDDGRLVRTALATPTLGLGWPQLDARFSNELEWEACVLQFRGYRECWRRQGVLPMLRRLLNDFHVPARLLRRANDGVAATPFGERMLTDVLHLAELLQQASVLIEGEHGLIRYLAEQRDAAAMASGGGDARQIRLESDGDLVKVVTIHKSKGLEYPLVFLPFACAYRATKKDDLPLKWHDADGALNVALTDPDGFALASVDRERLGEDLRKLYVALTRARYATWIGLGPLEAFERSAIGYLLTGGVPLAGAGAAGGVNIESALTHALGHIGDIAIEAAPEPTYARFVPAEAHARYGAARTSVRVAREPWWIASYSSLKTVGDLVSAAPETAREDEFIEARDAEGETADADGLAELAAAEEEARASLARKTASKSRTLHDFPRGSDQGSFLHDLLEWAAQYGFRELANDPEPLREIVARRCAVRGWERWIAPLTEWILRVITTPFVIHDDNGMTPATLVLADLEASICEMEFWLAAEHVDATALDALVREHTIDGRARPLLEATRLNGMLKGFMDLVFEHEGRYYVADYKSNWLGADDASYHAERIREQMLRSRYDLQFTLYLLALHRLLKVRLPDYDYDEHIGGAVYLFLRGIGAATQGVFAEKPPRELIEALDALFAGETGSADVSSMEAL